VSAATHRRPEVYVVWPTVKAIVGNRLAAGLIDRYLARTGYESQQTDEPADQQPSDNLWAPLDDTVDHGAHGVFGARAREWSAQLWANTHRGWLALAGAGLASAALAVLQRGAKRLKPSNAAHRGA
jgi:hypothetical protein